MSRENGKRKKGKKFEPVRVLNQRLFQKNKGRNLVAVLAILMTAMMFATLFTLAQSMSENLVEMTFRQTGYDAQVSFKSIQPDQAKILANHSDVKETGESTVLGLAENKALSGKQVEIRWADKSYASHSFCMPTTGHMPENGNEAALDTLTLKRLGVEPKLGKRLLWNGERICLIRKQKRFLLLLPSVVSGKETNPYMPVWHGFQKITQKVF